eukprot:CAMPEP_0184701982 /NCGR_PEP_ID=MMETSP0313-20130426/22347_1 /TAXON_ID=2792 /ORGANISM="Porphyridium aerugineum, Strain SAG 1380-2" /LENGTH=48 /DNA_ID= /DNA_START= /DNA_END= /DNA_ORIENTATION=
MDKYSISRQISRIHMSDEDNCGDLSHHTLIWMSKHQVDSGRPMPSKDT